MKFFNEIVKFLKLPHRHHFQEIEFTPQINCGESIKGEDTSLFIGKIKIRCAVCGVVKLDSHLRIFDAEGNIVEPGVIHANKK